MSESERQPVVSDRFDGVEHPGNDFPYYNGIPVSISGLRWWFVMVAVALGLAIVIAPIPFLAQPLTQFIPAILFAVIPLAVLALVAQRHWTAIFRRVTGRDILWMIAFAILNFLVTLVVGYLYSRVHDAQANPAIAGLATSTTSERVLFFLKTIPQLFGEEVMTILPFLALMTFFYSRLHWTRTRSILGAWLISAILFGLAHLPAYGGNVSHVLIIIGTARLMLTLAYLKTKNIWVSTGAHIINDWGLFGFAVLVATLG